MFSLYPRNSWCRENSDVTNMADSWYHCRCGIYFATEARYQRHQCFLTNNADRPVDERAEKVKTNMESKTFFQCEECGDFFDDMTIFQNHACARARDHQDPNAQVLCDVREPSKDEKGNNYSNSWTRNATLLLIDLYKKYKDQILSGKIRKKVVWERITNQMRKEGYSFHSEQVAGRWKSLLRAYKNVKDYNKKFGSGKKTYEYENELDDILGNDPIINPTFTLSSDTSSATEKRKLDESEDSDVETSSEQASCSTSAPKKKLVKRGTERQRNEMMQVFKEYIHEQKEERIRREELQREKMGLMRELIDVMKESTKK
ncbi:uncharacterized protein LOC125672779 isoform X1 [Ostrea edulis]|uniref:uncharacterized protein LOC125672779 isoform X1 n=1 Tax=Ostrea edulis TaxID=37623 RepID=UPI0024AF54C2|nr:uncharacterized protein LOC125672779 isoform X1 [Ostrea edulis]